MAQSVRAAVIGLGTVARHHLLALPQLDGYELEAVVDVDAERAAAAAAEHGGQAFSDTATMLAEIQPEVCVVCVPHGLHESTTIACLEAGAHVLLEKPMANTAAECDAINAAAERCGRQLMVGYTWHHRYQLAETRRRIEATGDAPLFGVAELSYEFARDTRPRWFFSEAMGGGSLLANGCHGIDWLRYGFGAKATHVSALCRPIPEDLGVDSVAAAQIRFAGGGVGQLIVWGRLTGGSRTRFEFRCRNHGYAWAGKTLTCYTDEGVEELPLEQPENPFLTEHKAFADSIREGTPPPITGAYGREISAIVDAIRESERTGREVEVS